MRLRELEQQLTATQAALEETRHQAATQAQESESTYRDKLAQLDNDYQSAVQYVKGTEKMLKQLKDQLTRYKTENSKLKEQLVDLEERVSSDPSSSRSQQAPADWETQQKALQAEIERLETELHETASRLEEQLQSVQQEREETHRRLDISRRDLEQLQQENALLEHRAQDAEQKVSTLLDQVELSVDNYRRRSRQVPSLNSESIGMATASSTNGGGNNGNGNHHHRIPGHLRQESTASEAESLYDPAGPSNTATTTAGGGGGGSSSGLGEARNSAALDNLANELETLRSHWETTNKNYRLSNTFDFDSNPVTAAAAANVAAGGLSSSARRDDGGGAGLGLSESLADWRKRLDESHPDAPGGAK
jgi:hypothetical protein